MAAGARRASRPDQAAFVLLVITLCFAPLTFGSTEAWSLFTVQVLLFAIALFCLLRSSGWLYPPGSLPLLLCLAWIFFQCLPLPLTWVEIFSPQTLVAYQPLLQLDASLSALPLSLNPQANLLEGLRYSAYALAYGITVQVLHSHKRILHISQILAGLALLLALLTLFQQVVAPKTFFWLRVLADGRGSFGPWINPNQYAGFMLMLCPLLVVLSLWYRPIESEQASCKDRLLILFARSGAGWQLWWGFGALVVLASIFLSASRGGILSASWGLLLLFFLLAAHRQGQVPFLSFLFLGCSLVIMVGWFSWEPILARFEILWDTPLGRVKDDRLLIWQDTLHLIKDFPLTGSGFGTFADVFPLYKSFSDTLYYDHAHNDYLELLSTGGLVGFCLAGCFVLRVLGESLWQGWRRRSKQAFLITVAGLSGLGGILAHSLTDFNLHNGANGLYFFFLCGLVVAASHTRPQGHTSLLRRLRYPRWVRFGTSLGVLFFGIALLLLPGRAFLANKAYNHAYALAQSDLPFQEKLEQMHVALDQARLDNPYKGGYAYALANLKAHQQDNKAALALYLEALRRQPLNSEFLLDLGLFLSPQDTETARFLLERAYQTAIVKEESLRSWAAFEQQQKNRSGLLSLLQMALQQHPSILLRTVHQIMEAAAFTQEEVAATLPPRTSTWLAYAHLARQAGKGNDFWIEQALSFIANESVKQPHHFMQVYNHYRNTKKDAQAEAVLEEGLRWLPDHTPFYIHLGDLAQGKGQSSLALQRYQEALNLAPKDESIFLKINEIHQEVH